VHHAVRRTLTLGVVVDACDDLSSVLEIISREMRMAAQARGNAFLVTFVNPSAVATAERNASFCAALKDFDLVLPDGIAMALAARHLSNSNAARISFDTTSLALPVLQIAAECSSSVILVGGKDGVARLAMGRMMQRYPGLRILGTWHGYGDMAATVQAVHRAGPDIVICGMGSGAQEEFLTLLKGAGWHGVGFTCGGYLDQAAGGLDYYPSWVDRANLRWLYRLACEPRRLWRRYLLDYGRFALRFGQAAMRSICATQAGHGTRR
jgi:N-acetylglucosaminyldiphosphoundecaprenol N-acetyl-beta-D-mannosaminyltransferase